MAWVAAGSIEPVAVTTYPVERVTDAQCDLEGGQTMGKLVLVLDGDESPTQPGAA